MARRLWLLVICASVLGSVACASPPTDDEMKLTLRRASKGVSGLGAKPRFVVLNAQTRMDAWSRVATSAAEGPSVRARAVGRDFKKGARQRVGVVVGGPQAQYVDRFVEDAFESAGTGRLPGLTLVIVSPKPPAEGVLVAVKSRGAKLVHRPMRR